MAIMRNFYFIRCNENQLDALFMLNFFKQLLHVSSVLLPIIRRYSLHIYSEYLLMMGNIYALNM
jgi:hypothetical protein